MSDHPIPLSRPDLSALEEELVLRVMRSGRLAIGPMQEELEALVAERAGCRHGVAVSSGTAGLFCVLRSLGVGPGDEVITTPLSFVASANVILHVGATPVFVDVDPVSLNMDPRLIEGAVTDQTKAILAVEAFGNPAYMDEYARIAARLELPLIEDSCEALGATHKGRRCGSFGRAGVFGFYPNKQITTGEGGVIVTDDSRLADQCRSLRNQGRPVGMGSGASARTGSWLSHERLGYNFRLSEVCAAIGVGQMRRFDEIVEKRRATAERYTRCLLDHGDLVLPTIDARSEMTWFVFVVRLAAGFTADQRNAVIEGMRNHGIGAADYFPCIHLMPFYREKFGFREGNFPIAESVSQRTLALPFFGELGMRDVELVCQTLSVMIDRAKLRGRE
ncbi:MAG: DegT/DnrJ/EryC1/StrS family aminotransferase [Planctomycetota bacterium]